MIEDWHLGRHYLVGFFLFLPSRSNGLPLSVESNSSLSVEVCGTPHACLISGEREHGQRNWERQVDSHLSGFDFMLELSGVTSRAGKDRDTISESVTVKNIDTFLKGINSNDGHDWSEDFLIKTYLTRA